MYLCKVGQVHTFVFLVSKIHPLEKQFAVASNKTCVEKFTAIVITSQEVQIIDSLRTWLFFTKNQTYPVINFIDLTQDSVLQLP